MLFRFCHVNFSSEIDIKVTYNSDGSYTLNIDGKDFNVMGSLHTEGNRTRLSCNIDGMMTSAHLVHMGDVLHLFSVVSNFSINIHSCEMKLNILNKINNPCLLVCAL